MSNETQRNHEWWTKDEDLAAAVEMQYVIGIDTEELWLKSTDYFHC